MKLKCKLGLAAALVLGLSGCTVNLTENQMQKALETCSKNDGVKSIIADSISDAIFIVNCNDGARFNL